MTVAMGRSSVTADDNRATPDGRPHPARLRTRRRDGTPVYGYAVRPGVPPVSVVRFDGAHHPGGLPGGGRHVHDFLVLVHVESGSGVVRFDGADHALRPGDVYAVASGRVMESGTLTGLQHCVGWSAFFLPAAVPALAAASPLGWAYHPLLRPFAPEAADGPDHGRLVVPPADRGRWSAWFAELAEETADPARLGAPDAAAAALTRLLVATARLAADVAGPGSRTADPLVARVFEVVERRFAEPISSADVAGELGYTPGHLTTLVRERTGRTLLEWITERRLTEVRRLLVETDLPLGVIAGRAGLRDAGYLVRRFRDRYGTTPHRWRRGERAPA